MRNERVPAGELHHLGVDNVPGRCAHDVVRLDAVDADVAVVERLVPGWRLDQGLERVHHDPVPHLHHTHGTDRGSLWIGSLEVDRCE